jgi:hypothetical protein
MLSGARGGIEDTRIHCDEKSSEEMVGGSRRTKKQAAHAKENVHA